MLTIKDLTVKVKNKTILKNISCNFDRGSVVAVIGPNGSGKSTLAHVVAGSPQYRLNSKSKLIFRKKSIKSLSADKRAKQGIFITFQNPPPLLGVNLYDIYRELNPGKKSILFFRSQIDKYCKILKINPDLLTRSLNDDFSGGEKKKLEMLQAMVIMPKLLIFDEIDTGLDVDALKLISKQIKNIINKERTIIIITHNFKILKYIVPSKVIVLYSGKIIASGKSQLATQIEKNGFDSVL